MATSLIKFNSEKKHSVRYDAMPGDEEPIATSIYIMKGPALPKIDGAYPRILELSVRVPEKK